VWIDAFLCKKGHGSIQVLQVLEKDPQGYPEEIQETMRRGEQGHMDHMTTRRLWHTPRRSIHCTPKRDPNENLEYEEERQHLYIEIPSN
jgi:hypothetical protein